MLARALQIVSESGGDRGSGVRRFWVSASNVPALAANYWRYRERPIPDRRSLIPIRPDQIARLRLRHAVFSTFNRAKFLSLPSTSVHGASLVLVRSTISFTARS